MSEPKPDRFCTEPGCRVVANESGLCNYHEVKKQWGKKWADTVYHNHPEANSTNKNK